MQKPRVWFSLTDARSNIILVQATGTMEDVAMHVMVALVTLRTSGRLDRTLRLELVEVA